VWARVRAPQVHLSPAPDLQEVLVFLVRVRAVAARAVAAQAVAARAAAQAAQVAQAAVVNPRRASAPRRRSMLR